MNKLESKKYSLIVARDKNNGIGFNNKLPWHYKVDLKFFDDTTIDGNVKNTLVIGRKTYESICDNEKILDKRNNIVLTKNDNYYYRNKTNTFIVNSFENAYMKAIDLGGKIFIAGGPKVYKQSIEYGIKFNTLEYLYLTTINKSFKCDTYFDFDLSLFNKDELIHKDNDLEIIRYKYNKNAVVK